MRFKIDANLPVEAAQLLNAAGHEAATIHDQQMVGQPDPNVASVCLDQTRALVTLDLDFPDIRTYPPDEYHGLIVLRPRRQAKPLVLGSLQGIVVPLLTRESVDRCRGLWTNAVFGFARAVQSVVHDPRSRSSASTDNPNVAETPANGEA